MHINLRYLQSTYQEFGARRTAHRYLMLALRRFAGVHLHHVVISGVTQTPPMPELPSDYTTQVVHQGSDVDSLVDNDVGFSPALIASAFSKGDIGAVNLYRGRLVGYGFTARSLTSVTPQIDAILPANFRYGYAAYTHPDHRGLGLARARWVARITQTAVPADERAIAYIATDNFPSLAMYYQDNASPVFAGYVGYISLLGKQLPFNSPEAKCLGFRFIRSSLARHGS